MTMKDVLFQMRVSLNEREEWRRQAKTEGLKVSEWIRRRCNKRLAVPVSVQESAEEIFDADEETAPIESQSPAKETPVERLTTAVAATLEEWTEGDRTAARKVGHALGCDCIHCVRIREAFSPKKEPIKQDKPAKKFTRKKKK